VSNPATTTITLTGPLYDACCFMSDFHEMLSHCVDFGLYQTAIRGQHQVETVISFTSADDEFLQPACDMAEHFPTLQITIKAAFEVKPNPALTSRMRIWDGVIEFAATEDDPSDHPVTNRAKEKPGFIMQHVWITPDRLVSCIKKGRIQHRPHLTLVK